MKKHQFNETIHKGIYIAYSIIREKYLILLIIPNYNVRQKQKNYV